MARYAIGDLQGCYSEFVTLLQRMAFDPERDRLYLLGDLVSRGPDSLAVLRWVYAHRHCCHVVLGNHDLHLLACASGATGRNPDPTTLDLLAADDALLLCDWLREQPLLIELENEVLSHAGIWPGWDLAQARSAAREVEAELRGASWRDLLRDMYGSAQHTWAAAQHEPLARKRFIVNAFTRMRLLAPDGSMLLQKSDCARPMPWFAWPERVALEKTVLFGHWSALGVQVLHGVVALDAGCVWGGMLVGMDLDTRRLYQVPARRSYQTIGE